MEPKRPIEKEIEKYSEDDYDQMLDEIHGEFMGYSASMVLKEVYPIAYRCGFSDYQEYEVVWECPECGTAYDYEEEALWCCQKEEDYEY